MPEDPPPLPPPPPPSLPPPLPPPDLLPPLAAQSSTEAVRPYRDPRTLAKAVTILLLAVVALDLAFIGARASQQTLLEDVRDDPFSVTVEELEDSDDRVAGVGALYLLGFLATGIVFIVWTHRLYSNLPVLGSRPLRFATRWAATAWFVPALNLVRPFGIVQDVWRGSDPEAPPVDPEWQHRPMSGLVALWWGVWLAGIPLGMAARISDESAESIDDLLQVNTLSMVESVLSTAAAILAVFVVRSLTRRQTERAQRLGLTG